MTGPMDAPLYVLAGGQSQRFGSDKARAVVDGQTMLQQVVEALGPAHAASERAAALLVTDVSDRYADLGLPIITDDPAMVGPIGGLRAALRHRLAERGAGWIALASCDLVRPNRDWLHTLHEAAMVDGPPAAAFYADRWEPMPALYHTDLLPQIEQQLQGRAHSLQKLLDACGACRVDLPAGLSRVPQANTAEELKAALGQGGVG